MGEVVVDVLRFDFVVGVDGTMRRKKTETSAFHQG